MKSLIIPAVHDLPLAIGAHARSCMVQPNSQIDLGAGRYEFGVVGMRSGRNLKSRGAGWKETNLINTGAGFSAQSCAWELHDGVLYEDLSLESRVGQGQQSQTVGFHGVTAPNDAQADLIRVRLVGASFVLYLWGGLRNRVQVFHSLIEGGKWGATAGVGSGIDGVFLDLFETHIIMDFQKYPGAGGDQMITQAGLVCRGGVTRMFGGSVTCIGAPELDVCAGAWTTPQGTKPEHWGSWPKDRSWPRLELYGVQFNTIGNGAKEVYDLYEQVGTIHHEDCKGSGPGGSLIIKKAA